MGFEVDVSAVDAAEKAFNKTETAKALKEAGIKTVFGLGYSGVPDDYIVELTQPKSMNDTDFYKIATALNAASPQVTLVWGHG
jgi:hypothetical protein